MAIEYSFLLGAPATVDDVASAMVRADAAHRMADEGGARFDSAGATYLSSGVFVYSGASMPLPFLDPVREVFGFDPAVDVGFRHQRGPGSERQDQDMVRLVGAVLTDVDGDALFLFAREGTRLVRIGGVLTVNAATDFWTPELVALLPPHELAELEDL